MHRANPPTADLTAFRRALEAVIEGEVRFDKVSRALYSTDASVYQVMPVGVVIPRSRQDVLETLRLCRSSGISITARGGGTSQAGQAVGAGVQLDFSKSMNRILEVRPDERTVRVEPGIVLDELNAHLKPHGLELPLDLSSSNRATIGGMIANNSSGTRSVVYGKTIDYVEELTIVLADGSVVDVRPLDDDALAAKCEQDDLEGACHRVLRQLTTENAEEIRRRYPTILRRVGGYNLDEFLKRGRPFNLSRLIVGSEGTLALVVEAKLRLVEPPKHRAVCTIEFSGLLEAMAATSVILEQGPSAVELVDRFILNTTRGRTEFEPLRDFITGDPAAVLIVEFAGDAAKELRQRIETLEADLRRHGFGYHVHRAVEAAAQAKIWKLRRAALGLSMSERGDAKAISFVEDTAVAPERLRDYIERFQEILARHQTRAGFYAHASVGLLHVRPVVDLKTDVGIEMFQRIAEEVSDLVLEFGGALSGEHGDGLARSPFQRKMYGSVLYEAFGELKRTFDPTGTLNPGKIVEAPPVTENLRFGPKYETRDLPTVFSFSDFGGIARAAEQCSGVGSCRKTLTGTLCPSYMATREETDSTRGRANALRLAISGQLGPDGLTDRELLPTLDLCLECKACKSECPTGVDMARMKAEFLHQYYQRNGTPFRSRVLARVDRVASWGSGLAPVSNWIVRSRPVRWLNEKLLGLDRRRTPPAFQRRTFLDWWRAHSAQSGTGAQSPPKRVVIYPDTFTNYYEPEHAIAAVRLAEAAASKVIVPEHVCCGRPLISKGLLNEARHQAEASTRVLEPLAERGLPIVFLEPSCYSAVRDDHPLLLRGESAQRAATVASVCVTFEEWAAELLAECGDALMSKFRHESTNDPKEILFHGHCHQKALVGTEPAVRLLSMVSSANVVDLDSGCCGMAGSFGYEREHYEISRAISERRLLPAVRGRRPGTAVVASGFSCRHQIRHFADVDAVSPAVLLGEVLYSGRHRSKVE